jgi:hypothetical protein
MMTTANTMNFDEFLSQYLPDGSRSRRVREAVFAASEAAQYGDPALPEKLDELLTALSETAARRCNPGRGQLLDAAHALGAVTA